MLKEVGLESRLERGESGSLMQGDREGVPDGWAIGRKKSGEPKVECLERGVCRRREDRRQSEESEREYRGGEI